MDKSSIPIRHPKVVWEKVDATAILVHLTKGTTTLLNESGTQMWTLMNGKRTLLDVLTLLLKRYNAPKSTLESTLLTFVNGLKKENYLKLKPRKK